MMNGMRWGISCPKFCLPMILIGLCIALSDPLCCRSPLLDVDITGGWAGVDLGAGGSAPKRFFAGFL